MRRKFRGVDCTELVRKKAAASLMATEAGKRTSGDKEVWLLGEAGAFELQLSNRARRDVIGTVQAVDRLQDIPNQRTDERLPPAPGGLSRTGVGEYQADDLTAGLAFSHPAARPGRIERRLSATSDSSCSLGLKLWQSSLSSIRTRTRGREKSRSRLLRARAPGRPMAPISEL